MVRQSFVLDPNAQAYTDDEIVGKVNTATDPITRVDAIDPAALGDVDLDDIAEGTTNKVYTDTEKTKLGGIAEGAQPDQTGTEVRDLMVALSDTERVFVMTEPAVGEFPIITIERKADGKTNVQYDNVPIE